MTVFGEMVAVKTLLVSLFLQIQYIQKIENASHFNICLPLGYYLLHS